MSKLLVLVFVVASVPAHADSSAQAQSSARREIARIGSVTGFQRTDRSAWVFGPSLEVRILDQLSIRGEVLIELGDADDPFGPSNLRDGSGPHVNHVMFGPTWRPARYAEYQFALGAEAGVLIMHSTFAEEHFAKKPAAGVFAQAGRMLGPVSIALQIRFDFSASIPMAGPEGERVPTTSGRINLLFELPIKIR